MLMPDRYYCEKHHRYFVLDCPECLEEAIMLDREVIKTLKQENEEIKKENEELKKKLKDIMNTETFKTKLEDSYLAKYNELESEHQKLKSELKEYKLALNTMTKDFASKINNMRDFYLEAARDKITSRVKDKNETGHAFDKMCNAPEEDKAWEHLQEKKEMNIPKSCSSKCKYFFNHDGSDLKVPPHHECHHPKALYKGLDHVTDYDDSVPDRCPLINNDSNNSEMAKVKDPVTIVNTSMVKEPVKKDNNSEIQTKIDKLEKQMDQITEFIRRQKE